MHSSYLAPVVAVPEEHQNVVNLLEEVLHKPRVFQALLYYRLQHVGHTVGPGANLQLRKRTLGCRHLVGQKVDKLLPHHLASVGSAHDFVVAEQAVSGQDVFGLVGQDEADAFRVNAVAQQHGLELARHGRAEVPVAQLTEGHDGSAELPGFVDEVKLHHNDGILCGTALVAGPQVQGDVNGLLAVRSAEEGGLQVADELRFDVSLHLLVEVQPQRAL